MPVYPFECNCGRGFEVVASIKQGPDPTCKCGRRAARVLCVPAVISGELFKNQKTGLDQFSEAEKPFREEQFKRQGVSPMGKVYCPLVARFPGDPEALVDNADDLKRVAAKRRAEREKPLPHVPLAEDLTREMVDRHLAHIPPKHRTAKMLRETREMVHEKHGSKPLPPGKPKPRTGPRKPKAPGA